MFLLNKGKKRRVYRCVDNRRPGLLKTTGRLNAQENNYPASKDTGFFVPLDTKQTSHALMRHFSPKLCDATDMWHVRQTDQKWPTACITVQHPGVLLDIFLVSNSCLII